MTDPNDPAGSDRLNKRLVALGHAVDLHRSSYKPGDTNQRGDLAVTRSADVFTAWLNRAAIASIAIEYDQTVTRNGDTVQIKADAPSPLTGRIVLLDSKGNKIPDDPSTNLDDVVFTLNPPDSPLALTVQPDDRSFSLAIVAVGDTTFTGEVQTDAGPRTVIEAMQVIPGALATMAFEFDTPPAPGA